MHFSRTSMPLFAVLAALLQHSQAAPVSPSGGNEDIVGGQEANSGDFPYLAYLENRVNGGACTASLISETKLITAAHCFGGDYPPSRYDVRLNSLDRTKGGTRIPLSNIVLHPLYNPDNTNYDIAVITLSSPAPAGILLPNLVRAGQAPTTGENVQIAGWGRLYTDGPTPTRAEKVSLQVIDPNTCEGFYAPGESNMGTNVCLGEPEGGRGSCNGDSGGPAVIHNRTIIAVSSYGGAYCASDRGQSVYQRIDVVEDFIQDNM